MASINQGDDAVERLDNAVTAFEQIMTGPEGQTVQVPGHQPQPTLAERVKQNLKPSTDAAAGYAAQASACAKAADESAKQAAQISGLETVADAIGLAAMPLPDVWAPLTDSLRLFTGLGREVKIGDDVVGRYVSFERQSAAWYFDKSGVLKQAAINEPRFEAEGLLVEGPSTNILKWDQTRAGTGSGTQATVMSSKYPGITAKKITGGTSPIALGASKEILKDNTQYSATAIIDLANSNIPNNKIRLTFAYGANWVGNAVTVDITTLALSIAGPTVAAVRRYGDLLVITATATSTASASTSGGGSLDLYYIDAAGSGSAPPADGSVCVVGFQLEEGPIASSFILTGNAAVTRAADLCEIPTAGNIPAGKFTATAQVNAPWLGKSAPNTAPRILSITGGEAGASVETTIYSDGRFNAFGGVSGASSIVSGFANRSVVSMVRSDTGLVSYAGGKKNVGTQGIKYGVGPSLAIGSQKGSTGRHFFGHIRNIKIWHQEATDAQIKALR
ncbi:TPA: phage head spike fiber domain-containing protein [Aeromonas veronii]